MSPEDIERIASGGPGEYKVNYVYNGKKFTFTVNVGTVDQNAAINLNGYGSGYTSDSKYYDQYIRNNPGRNSIDIRLEGGSNAYATSGWDGAISGIINDLSDAFQLDKSNTMVSGFSMSAHKTIGLAATYANTTGANDFTAIIIEDVQGHALPEAQRQILIDHNVTVINAYANPSNTVHDSNSILQTYEGVHLIDIKFNVYKNGRNVSSGSHVVPHDLLALNGITNIGNGSFDFTELPTEYHDRNQGDVTIEYVITEHYVDEEGKWVSRQISLDEANRACNCGPYYGGIIQSDNEYLQTYLTNINAKLTALTNSAFNLNVTSTTTVPQIEPALVAQLKNAIQSLGTKLHDEMVIFGKVGNRFSELDLSLEEATNVLMSEFMKPLTSTKIDIPINDMTTYDYDLDQLIKDYNQYVKDFKDSIPEYSPEILRDKDMTDTIYDVTAEDLDRLFEHWAETTGNENSKLLGMGAAFIAASEATGIDPLTLVGIVGKETGYGGDGTPGNLADTNNFFGLDLDENQTIATPEEGILLGAQKLKADYETGTTTVGQLGVDPNAENPDTTYGNDVSGIMDESLDYIIDTTAQPIEVPGVTPTNTDDGKTDPGAKDPGKTDPGRTDPGKTDPGKTDPGKTDPGQTDPGKTDPGKTDPGKTDPGTEDPGKTDPGTEDPGEEEPGPGDNIIVDPEPEPENPEPEPENPEPENPDPEPTPKPGKPTRPDPIPTPKPDPIPTPDPKTPEPDDTGSNKYEDLDDYPGLIDDPEPTPDPIEDDPGLIVDPDPTPDPIEEEPKPEPEPTPEGGNGALKTIGVMAAVGAGVGAAAYAAHRIIDKNDTDDSYYQYEKSSKKDDEKQESLDEQYKEYYSDDNMNAFGGEQ